MKREILKYKFKVKLLQSVSTETQNIKDKVIKTYDLLIEQKYYSESYFFLVDSYVGNVYAESGPTDEFGREIDIWSLEKYTRSSKNEISLGDVFECEKWDRTYISLEKYKEMVKVGWIFTDFGLLVFCVAVIPQRKGYDYEVYQFNEQNKNFINSFYDKEYYFFRIYVTKNWSHKLK